MTHLANENWQTGNRWMLRLHSRNVFIYIIFQCLSVLCDVHIGTLEIVVDVDEVETATCACLYEGFEVG